MKRVEEEFCKTQFDAFVRRFFAPSEVIWKEVAQQDEPPDYYLFLSTTKFAVEVTTLMEKALVGSSLRLPHAVISKIFQDFVDEVGTIAKTKGYLHGDYLVSFPTPIDDFAFVRDAIQEGLLEYIRSTSSLERAPLKVVFKRTVPQQRPQQCGIQKVSNKLDRVIPGGPVWMKWEGDAAADICGLLNESINTKKEKLRDISAPKILLLFDEYRFADSKMYESCIPQLSSLSSFHIVFVVQGNKRGFVLYSRNCSWLR